ncbi:excinuclease ABC subunit UvrC [Thiospirochaeta perfilievii]|uniref:UvrABC system protein C n=1 Tax=Thiospirochaeta perfilievii TaxID=252967 RepID=A0A5C1QBC7_9SPIO|nr:excinuclease ABC subunit UvrC [Thiospirochaeta perfilievii]QEN04807.1 excinuclease ABC subunit UvrC [Thiospirochaeta perfilievii]
MKNNQEIINKLKNLVKEFPLNPGIYIMRDNENQVIYVGKAKKLQNRVLSYFNSGKDIKTTMLMKHVFSLEYTVTDTEYEALLLENNLIKKWNPKYNISLKDGKSYGVIAITKDEYPLVYKTRNTSNKNCNYYGPFPDTRDIYNYLEIINRLYPLRTCKGKLKARKKPCLMYHIKKCDGPCINMESKDEYNEKIKSIKKILSGNINEVVTNLNREMAELSSNLEFEKAAELRDLITSLVKLKDKQKIVDFNSEFKDFIGLYNSGDKYTFVVLKMREGFMVDKAHYYTSYIGTTGEGLLQFLIQYYSKNSIYPGTIYLPMECDIDFLEKFFIENSNKRVYIKVPEKGKNLNSVLLANENAKMNFEKRIRRDGDFDGLYALKEALNLPELPQRIEGFDIAQLDGHFTVSSLVSFYNGVPDKKNYKRFKMKSLNGKIDDFKSISEAVARRYTRVINENLEKPDLILIDGGKGQVSSAKDILDTLGLEIPLAGLAKKYEHVFLPGRSEPIILKEGSPGLRILQAVRDETHRFATDYNKLLRKKKLKLSSLESVPGIGPKRAKKILLTFGDLDKIKESNPKDISTRAEINLELAETIYEYLNKK